MKITSISFQDLKTAMGDKKEGLVLLGCGGDLNEWVTGITKELKKQKISPTAVPSDAWDAAYRLETPKRQCGHCGGDEGGRIDLVLVFKIPMELNIGKMALWRLQFGDASWWSDYVVNYAKNF